MATSSIYGNEIIVTYKPRTGANRSAAVERVLEVYAMKVMDRARALAPVETGELRDSIDVHVANGGFILSAGYGLPDGRARFQEYGFHHYQTGNFIINPYARPAFESYKREFRAALRNAIAGREW
jgi:hypothetical protein